MTEDSRDSIVHEAASKAAHDALNGFFKVLGVDIDDREQVQELRKDFSHNRRWRKRMDRIGETATTTITKYVVIAIIGVVAIGLSDKLRSVVTDDVPQQVENVVEEIIE